MRVVAVTFALFLAASTVLAQGSFYNWETPPVHPVDMTPDGTKLLVTNTADDRLEVLTLGGALPVPAFAVPGGPSWTQGATSSVYRNRFGYQGITRVVVKKIAKTPGQLRFAVVGRGMTLAVTPASLPLRATLVIDVPTTSTGQCGEATFPGPAPAPHCGLSGTGKTAFCR